MGKKWKKKKKRIEKNVKKKKKEKKRTIFKDFCILGSKWKNLLYRIFQTKTAAVKRRLELQAYSTTYITLIYAATLYPFCFLHAVGGCL